MTRLDRVDPGHADADAAGIRRDARTWFTANWDPGAPLQEWWEKMATAGWAFPTLPADCYGKGLTPEEAALVDDERRRAHAAPPPSTLGARIIVPLLVDHGTDEQRDHYILPTISGQAVWCELFSEPGAGSDLASLATRATRADDDDGDNWIVTGQKVWTSGAAIARWGLLTARTDPDRPKREGLTCFLLDMDSAGVDVRPLRSTNGDEKFSEVFLTDVVIPSGNVFGAENDGWALTRETLALERRALGRLSDNHKPPPLDRPAGQLAAVEQAGQQRGAAAAGAGSLALVRRLLEQFPATDPTIRQDVARLYSMLEISRHLESPEPAKLLTSNISRTLRDLALRLEGPFGMLLGDDAPMRGVVQKLALTSPSMSIMTGTDEIQKNVIGERILGLPREPAADAGVPWRRLRVGTQARDA